MPLATDEFFSVFARYNEAIWAPQILAYVLAVIAVWTLAVHESWSAKALTATLVTKNTKGMRTKWAFDLRHGPLGPRRGMYFGSERTNFRSTNMMKTRNDAADRSGSFMSASPFGTAPSLETVLPAVASMAEVNGKTILGWMALQREWTGFLMHRVQEEIALTHRLAKCSGPQDLYGIYANFYQQAFADYQREFGEMMRLGQASLSEATSAAQRAMETAARDAP